MKQLLILLMFLTPLAQFQKAPVVQETATVGFKKAFRQAIRKARVEEKITVKDALRLQMAITSPAFAKVAEDIAILELMSRDVVLPVDTDGNIQREVVDWLTILEILITLMPYILELLTEWGVL